MQVLIRKRGNNASVRIPAAMMAAASLNINQAVEVREENGRIIIEAIGVPTYALNELLAGMRPETFPDCESFGPAVDQETWLA